MHQKIKKFIYLFFKAFYYLFPKVLREQYSDSKAFYSEIMRKVNLRMPVVINEPWLLSLVKSPDLLGLKFNILESKVNRTSKLGRTIIYDKTKQYSYLDAMEENVLDINIYHFESVAILGNTDSLICDSTLFHQELLNMNQYHDLKRSDIFTFFDREQKDAVAINTQKTKVYNEEKTIYISLLKEHSQNYYHWITENIPRLILIAEILSKDENEHIYQDKTIAILIDEAMPKQCIEIISLVFPYPYTIDIIKKGELCQCHNLVYCSALWQSLDNTKGTLDHKEFFVDKHGLVLVQNSVFKSLNLKKKEPFRKIYLRRRPSQMRSILNNAQVEAYMRTKGFEIIEIEKMSFIEQVSLFCEAAIVVGASGATFTNILFMQPQTKAIIFYPNHPSVNHGIFQPLADVAGIRFIHFQTIAQDLASIHSNFYIDIHRLNNLIELEG